MAQSGEGRPRAPLLHPPPSRPSAYERFVRLGVLAWAGIGVIVLAYLLLRLLVYVNPVVPPLLLAVVVVYLLNPVVSALEQRGVPRVAGAGVVYVLFLCLVALAVSLLVPVVTRQVSQVIDHFPGYVADAQAQVRRVAARFGAEPLTALWAALVLLAVQQLDNHLISPNVMSRTVQLHPVVVMLALLVGASFAGLFGMLVIVPLVAVAKIVFLFLWSRYVDYGDDLVGGTPE